MNLLRVHGGGAVFARISERLGLRLQEFGMVWGIETVRGLVEASVILVSSSSPSTVEEVGEEAAEEVVDIMGLEPNLRAFMTDFHRCLYRLRASGWVWSWVPEQEQKSGLSGCASLSKGSWHRDHLEAGNDNVRAGAGSTTSTRAAWSRDRSRSDGRRLGW